ncbi:MAG: hypothetical protein ACJZ9K_02185 [Alphaproteobacteria bacterium]
MRRLTELAVDYPMDMKMLWFYASSYATGFIGWWLLLRLAQHLIHVAYPYDPETND